VGSGNSTDQDVRKAPPLTEFQVSEGSAVFIELDENVYLEPVSPESYDLSYTCLLIPRFPNHILRGDITEYLLKWLQDICLSGGWQLGFTNVQQEFLQWSIRVPPSVSPGHFMQVIRLGLSESILHYFPKFTKENRMKDFWAPGYLVILGMRPHPPQMVEQFIRLTRRQQGIIK